MPGSRGSQRRPSVELYERIVNAIRAGDYPPGSALPSEPELAGELGVSRPALREALILLQEDGVITVRRGVGRTVSTGTPHRGFERLNSVEKLLGGETAAVRVLARSTEEPTDLVLQHLPVPAASEIRFWESIVDVDGSPACLVQEWILPDDSLAELSSQLPEALRAASEQPRTMLDVLTSRFSELSLRGSSAITASVLGGQRGAAFRRPSDTPVVLITQVVRSDSTPLLIGKYMLPSGAPAVPLLQTR
ncbi:transcriptional regulator, GntR family [Actinopolyspora xinjiangensis]|uniref:Transcriptional regulator, GntR family n=1 Tax=Actinopolyspora xinjiangensis TaxID=405564 RepID=A0A1H0RTY1_9ACTN|nr:GntR family transcriptional regulator [Actinopolyspora xinjiangensis]SDP32789.1 transcriptional regulator, GntR family [Actinopolyspora xinjiangensis]